MSSRPMFRVEIHIEQSEPPTYGDLVSGLDVIDAVVFSLDSHVFGQRQLAGKNPTTGLNILMFTTSEVNDTANATYVASKKIEDGLKKVFPDATYTFKWFDEDTEAEEFRWDTGDEEPEEPEDG